MAMMIESREKQIVFPNIGPRVFSTTLFNEVEYFEDFNRSPRTSVIIVIFLHVLS